MSAATSISIIRDLVEVGIGLVREAKRKEVKALGREERRGARARRAGRARTPGRRRAKSWRRQLRNNELNDKEIEIQVAETGGAGSRPSTSRAARSA